MTSAAPANRNSNVLVVDDQPDVREALRLLLKSAGYATRMAESPDEAMATLAIHTPDLIVLDMNYTQDTTSGREGIALIDRIRALPSGIPIIAMTGWGAIELAVEAMQHGASDFITKPWDINHLLPMCEKHVRAARSSHQQAASRNSELAIAQRIQQRLLPEQRFAAAGLQFDCAFLPVREVGGDLYDYFSAGEGSVAFLLGDVCGKGLGAAMLVATLQSMFRSQRDLVTQPAALLKRINSLFFEVTRPEHFATVFFGLYQADTASIRYVNCGHPSAVLLNHNGDVQTLEPSGMVLGAFEHSSFEERSVRFGPDDRLLIFSDGVSEAGLEIEDDAAWPLETVRLLGRDSHPSLAQALATAARNRAEQDDDITVLSITPQLAADALSLRSARVSVA